MSSRSASCRNSSSTCRPSSPPRTSHLSSAGPSLASRASDEDVPKSLLRTLQNSSPLPCPAFLRLSKRTLPVLSSKMSKMASEMAGVLTSGSLEAISCSRVMGSV
eukprot:11114445-Heterocapsa_arctica.AAC.2